MYYHEGSNKFILEDGESTPEDVFICLNDYLMGDEDVYEGRTEKASKEKDSDVKLEQFRKTISDFLKGKDCKTKKVGDDFEVHFNDEHVAQVMFRKDYVGVKKEGNKFPKEFDYNELGKIKSELTNIIKSEKIVKEMKHIKKFNESNIRIQSTVPRPESVPQRLSDEEMEKQKQQFYKSQEEYQRVDPYFLQEVSDRLYGPDSVEYVNALKELNKNFRPRVGKTGHDIYK